LEGNYSTKKNFRENFYDLNIRASRKIIQEAERLGFAGVSLTYNFDDYNSEISKEYDEIKLESNILIRKCLELSCKNQEELRKKVQKSRKKADIIMVIGGDTRVNRAACEDRNVDILSQPYRNRRDSGMNHVLARKASENDVAIEINLASFLKTSSRYRHRVISQFRHIMDLKRKYGFSVILTSGARSTYDQRNPLDIFALSNCFGMTKNESFEALSTIPQYLIDRNDRRANFVVDGVSTV
jgi:ribonuclease P/MRP protein subunit RPP1